MLKDQILKKSFHRFSIVCIIILIVWKGILFYIFPFPNADGPWYLSQCFSLIRGDFFKSSFAHSYMGFYNLPYMFAFLNSPFYALFTGTHFLIYSIFFCNLIWIITTLFGSFYFLKRTNSGGFLFLLFSLSLLLSSYAYSLRSEIFCLPILLLLLYFLNRYAIHGKNPAAVGLIAAIIGMIHPVGGFYAVFFILIFCFDNKISFQKIFLILLTTAVFVIVLYAPVILKNVDLWKLNFFKRGFENDTRHIDFSYPVKFFSYSLPLLVLIVFYISNSKEWLKEIFFLTLCILSFFFFMRSYYYPYIFHFVLWRLTCKREYRRSLLFKVFFILSAAFGLLICFVSPSFQLKENNMYKNLFVKELGFAQLFAEKNIDKQVWVPANLSMAVIDKPNARLYISSYEHLSGTKIPLSSNNVFLLQAVSDIKMFQNLPLPLDDSFKINEIYPSIPGLKKLSGGRSDSLGLWMLTVVPKK